MSDVGLGFELEFTVPGLDALSPTARPNADVRLVIPGYFDAMGIRMVSGRDFDRLDASSSRAVAIVNETLVERYFRDVDPIGRPIGLATLGDVEVVGVASDIRHEGLASKYESEIFLPYGRPATGEMHIVVQSYLDTAAVANGVDSVLKDMDPGLAPSEAAAIADLLWQSAARPRFNAALLAGLALAAALLAIVGTYGIVAYSVSQRRGEIGLRMALGADSKATVLMILRQALGIVVNGALLGTLGALGATRFLRGLLFEVEPTDPLTYGVVLVASVAVGALAAWISALRATRIHPVVALRSE
jgi:ABC-type antimicrobial peptide transport system permease subunit